MVPTVWIDGQRWRYTFAMLLLAFNVSAADFPGPPDAEITRLASSVTSLGMKLQIRRFQVDMTVDEVLEFYQQLWEDEAVETEMAPWKMVGTRQDRQYLNVQVQGNGKRGSWGYLSISDLPGRLDDKTYDVQMGEGFPMMSGSRVMDDQVSKDPGKEGRVLLIENNFSPFTNLNYYKQHFTNRGWDMVMDEQIAPRQGGYALYFSKGPESLTLTINKIDGKTSVVANPVKRGLLK